MKANFKSFLFATFFSLFMGIANAQTNQIQFNEQIWKEVQEKKELALIFIHADWCSTCKAQDKILDSYFQTYPQSKLKRLIVNYDTQKEWVKYFKAPRQSTIYIYKGNEQLLFSVAETNKDKIFEALKKAEGI